jgi:hypothetical protein
MRRVRRTIMAIVKTCIESKLQRVCVGRPAERAVGPGDARALDLAKLFGKALR